MDWKIYSFYQNFSSSLNFYDTWNNMLPDRKETIDFGRKKDISLFIDRP
jgi:hypothetical protein